MNQKTKILGIAVIAILALVAVGAGVAFAQSSTPPSGYGPGWMMGDYSQDGPGYGMMGWRGGTLGGFAQDEAGWEWMESMHAWMTAEGGMHTFVWDALGELLGMTSDELTAAVNSDQSLAEIAGEKGVSRAELISALESAHAQALVQAVEAGYLTQEQADSILSHMAGRYELMIDRAAAIYGPRGGYRGMMGGAYGLPGADGQFVPGSCHGYWGDSTPEQPSQP